MAKKKLKDLIPSSVRITSKVKYEIVFIDAFPTEKQVGEARYDAKQIVIKNGLSDSESWGTFIHEVMHAMSFEYGEKNQLTETQVLWLEKAIKNYIRLNNIV